MTKYLKPKALMIALCASLSLSFAIADDTKMEPSANLLKAYTYLSGNTTELRDPAAARSQLIKAIEQNSKDADARLLLSTLYQMGIGGERDYSKSIEVIMPLVDQGNPIAQSNLAAAYMQGLGVPQDFQKAFHWAEQSYIGDPDNVSTNQYLGYIYMIGLGTKQDFEKSAFHYEKSANAGSRYAQSELAGMYSLGIGVKQDYKTAYEWATKAAKQGDANATEMLFSMDSEGLGTELNHEKAVKATVGMAIQGDAAAQGALAILYWFGIGTNPDINAAIHWQNESCSNGFLLSCPPEQQ